MSIWDLICCRRADAPKVSPEVESTDTFLLAEEKPKDESSSTSAASTEASSSELRPLLRFQKCVRKLKFIRLAAVMSNCNSRSGSFTSASAVGALETNLAIDDEFEEASTLAALSSKRGDEAHGTKEARLGHPPGVGFPCQEAHTPDPEC
eukprot:s1655_g2.t1